MVGFLSLDKLWARARTWLGNLSGRSFAAIGLICAVSSALMAPQVVNFATHDQLERNVLNGLPFWEALERTEFALLDRRFADRGARKPRSLDSIAIVGIDEASLHQYKQWPWPRDFHANLIHKLKQAGARVIGVDIGFEEYANPTIDKQTGATQLSGADQHLAKEIEAAGNVVLVSHFSDPQANVKAEVASDALNLVTPIDEFDSLTPDVAVAYVPSDRDGKVRRYPVSVVKPPEKEPLGGFAPLCVALYEKLATADDLKPYQAALQAGIWPSSQGTRHKIPLALGVMPGSDNLSDRTKVWTTPLDFWGPQGTFPTYSYYEVLNQWSEAKLSQHFKDRIVFIGATTHVLKDTFPVPAFDSTGKADNAEMPGVELHATMAAMLLDGTYIHTQSTRSVLWTVLGLTVVASLWTACVSRWASLLARRVQAAWARRHLPGRIYSFLWNVLCITLGPLPILAFWWGAEWALAQLNLWVVVVYPALGALIASGGTLLLLFGVETSERRKVLTQMSRLVAPAVMDEILAHPEEDYPRSRRVHATVLFTDLEGFTSYSESREPEEVVTALNAYFKRMQPIVHAHGGSVDKYIGDSVMAFFGAPMSCDDHAAQALRCAIAMQDECARFREETGVPFWMRVGVHTGDLIVGSVGSDEQNNYTAIGDTVNLASRLEASNKSFGSHIICSASTHAEAPDIALVERSQTPIRGKSGDVEILIVRGPLGELPRDGNWGRKGSQLDWDALQEKDRLIEGERRLGVDRRRQVERRREGDRRHRSESTSDDDAIAASVSTQSPAGE